MAAPDTPGPGRIAAAQVPLPVPAARRRSGRQVGRERPAGEAMVRRWLAVALAALLYASVAAAQATLEASVDRPVIHDNESFTYTIRADGSVRGEPELGAIKQDFDVLASTSEKRIGIVNGRTSEVTTWTYELMPKKAGSYALPQVRVGALQTNAVALRVTAPPLASTAPADIFMELEAQPSAVYVQSQVIVTLRL